MTIDFISSFSSTLYSWESVALLQLLFFLMFVVFVVATYKSNSSTKIFVYDTDPVMDGCLISILSAMKLFCYKTKQNFLHPFIICVVCRRQSPQVSNPINFSMCFFEPIITARLILFFSEIPTTTKRHITNIIGICFYIVFNTNIVGIYININIIDLIEMIVVLFFIQFTHGILGTCKH